MTVTIRVGVHPYNWSLVALSKSNLLERALLRRPAKVEWVNYPVGRMTPDYIGARLIDFGGTGTAPPITGQANGIPLVYVAASAPREMGGILVREESRITTPADLRGKVVALAGGSGLQHVLAVALDRNGLTWQDIIAVDLPEAVAQTALVAGGIDA
jgi:sulfonate transport system substrate-binding protein